MFQEVLNARPFVLRAHESKTEGASTQLYTARFEALIRARHLPVCRNKLTPRYLLVGFLDLWSSQSIASACCGKAAAQVALCAHANTGSACI